ncbi:MAG: DUF4982 domain-containing protein [Lachnospiraceae bacterium]|nr:DUF4982 domain-containing protein [Lachnospiraceae bacterium]
MIRDFNDNWTFRKEGDAIARPVMLPHDAMILEKRRASARGGTNNGYFPGGIYVYEKQFHVAPEELGKSIVVHFDGVYQNCTVSVNGAEAGSHRYGFSAFDVDISNQVVSGENRITVRVDNSLQPNCRWYTGSGIYRPVKLILREKQHIRSLRIRTVSIRPAVIRVESDAEMIEIYDGKTCVASGRPGEFRIPDAKPWTAEMPYLYTCTARLENDEVRVRFGIRELKWSGKNGLRINGEAVKLRGGCIHHDHGVLGAAELQEAEYRRIRILKENGFNAVRVSHNPASQILLDACDELGMYVIDEAFDGWYTPKTYHDYSRSFEKDWQKDLASMVNGSWNHPSVIIWSIGNEVTETSEKKGIDLCGRMRDYLHELDDTRPVTAGINVLLDVYTKRGLGIYRDKGIYRPEPLPENKQYREKRAGSAFFNYWTEKLGGLMFQMSKGRTAEKVVSDIAPSLDILGLNYASSRYEIDAVKHPDRLMLGTETMSGDLPYNWERVLKYPQLCGDFVWAAWDYIGETCMGWYYPSYPGLPLLSGQGMIDITGLPLAQMAFMQVVWGLRKSPYIGVRPLNHAKETAVTGAWQFTNALDSWTWHGFEGTKATVEVYANASSVRLSLNGKVIAARPVKAYQCIFHLPYEPGTLLAEAMDESGRVVSSSELRTGGLETLLSVRPERTVVASGEVFYVPVEFTDAEGVLNPAVEQRVEIEAENAVLLGYGSALTKTDEVFDQAFHDTYRGRALAVFRAGDPGTIVIKARSKGYPEVKANVEVRP